MDDLKVIGRRVNVIRKNLKITMVDFSLLVGVHKNTLCKIENGEVDVRYSTLKKIAKGLNISISELVK